MIELLERVVLQFDREESPQVKEVVFNCIVVFLSWISLSCSIPRMPWTLNLHAVISGAASKTTVSTRPLLMSP